MTEFYSRDSADHRRRRARSCMFAACAAAVAALTACIIMCCFVRTENAGRLLIAVIAVSVLGGWTAILLTGLVCRPERAQASHAEGILSGTASVHEGVITGVGEPFHIPKSIDTIKVTINDAGTENAYDLNAVFAPQLPPPGTRIRFRTVRKYITAVEVTGNE
ncbi:MAG: hypothetical protein Q4G19_08565 [Clostridia bacterium]|nr:hypothetical protein [Clostridia bacterium]